MDRCVGRMRFSVREASRIVEDPDMFSDSFVFGAIYEFQMIPDDSMV